MDKGLVKVGCDFVRGRNVLIAHADFRPLLEHWHAHHERNRLATAPEQDAQFEEALAAFALHLAVQPRNRHFSWTINIGRPAYNIFLGGSTQDCTVAGRIFNEEVAEFPKGQFYQEMVMGNREPFRSHTTFDGTRVADAVAAFNACSEQRPARLVALGGTRFAYVQEHPDCDMEWFRSLDASNWDGRLAAETLNTIETREFSWECGCEDRRRLLRVLLAPFRKDPKALFGDEPTLRMECPRCGARHVITLEEMEAFAAER